MLEHNALIPVQMGSLFSKPGNYLDFPLSRGLSDKKVKKMAALFLGRVKQLTEEAGLDFEMLKNGLAIKKEAYERIQELMAEYEGRLVQGSPLEQTIKDSLAPYALSESEYSDFIRTLVSRELLDFAHFFLTYYWLPREKVERMGEYDQRRYQAIQAGLSLIVTKFREFVRTKNSEVMSKVASEEMATVRLLLAVWNKGFIEKYGNAILRDAFNQSEDLNFNMRMVMLREDIRQGIPIKLEDKLQLDRLFFRECSKNFLLFDCFSMSLDEMRRRLEEMWEEKIEPGVAREEYFHEELALLDKVSMYKLACVQCPASNDLLAVAREISWFQ